MDPITPEEDKKRYVAWWKEQARKKRNELIAETDWIHLPDVTVSDSYKSEILAYSVILSIFIIQKFVCHLSIDNTTIFQIVGKMNLLAAFTF